MTQFYKLLLKNVFVVVYLNYLLVNIFLLVDVSRDRLNDVKVTRHYALTGYGFIWQNVVQEYKEFLNLTLFIEKQNMKDRIINFFVILDLILSKIC